LVIHTDNATFVDGSTHTELANRTFEISGQDLMKIYAMLNDREVTCLYNCRDNGFMNVVSNYMFIGKDVEKKRLMDMYVKLLKEVEEINNTRHWWERKIKIDSEL
jgi:hypothetical protein